MVNSTLLLNVTSRKGRLSCIPAPNKHTINIPVNTKPMFFKGFIKDKMSQIGDDFKIDIVIGPDHGDGAPAKSVNTVNLVLRFLKKEYTTRILAVRYLYSFPPEPETKGPENSMIIEKLGGTSTKPRQKGQNTTKLLSKSGIIKILRNCIADELIQQNSEIPVKVKQKDSLTFDLEINRLDGEIIIRHPKMFCLAVPRAIIRRFEWLDKIALLNPEGAEVILSLINSNAPRRVKVNIQQPNLYAHLLSERYDRLWFNVNLSNMDRDACKKYSVTRNRVNDLAVSLSTVAASEEDYRKIMILAGSTRKSRIAVSDSDKALLVTAASAAEATRLFDVVKKNHVRTVTELQHRN